MQEEKNTGFQSHENDKWMATLIPRLAADWVYIGKGCPNKWGTYNGNDFYPLRCMSCGDIMHKERLFDHEKGPGICSFSYFCSEGRNCLSSHLKTRRELVNACRSYHYDTVAVFAEAERVVNVKMTALRDNIDETDDVVVGKWICVRERSWEDEKEVLSSHDAK